MANSDDFSLADAVERTVAALARQQVQRKKHYGKLQQCSPADLLRFVQDRFEKDFNRVYEVDADNFQNVKLLSYYFSGHPGFEDMGEGYSLDKGLLIQGATGVGKSLAMTAFRRNPHQPYTTLPCRDCCIQYKDKLHGGSKVFERLSGPIILPSCDPQYFNHRHLGYSFEDLGTEPAESNSFGNWVNVMAEIYQARYDRRLKYSLNMTHTTTNMPMERPEKIPHDHPDAKKNIKDRYGVRVHSRFNENFNQIVWIGPDRRRSKKTTKQIT